MPKKNVETLADTVPQRVNANKHTQRGMGLLETSIGQRKWIGAITAAADGEIFDGSARREVLEAIGIEDAIIIHGDGTRPVICIRDDIPTADDPRAVQLALEANRIAQLNLSYDPGVLAEIEPVILEGMFFPEELSAILEQAGDELLLSAPEAFKEYDENVETEYCCPKCAYTWSGKPK